MKRIHVAIAIPAVTHLLALWLYWIFGAEFERGIAAGNAAMWSAIVSIMVTLAYLDLTKKKEGG